MAGTLGVSGASTLSGNTTIGGTLGVTGVTTLSSVKITTGAAVNKVLTSDASGSAIWSAIPCTRLPSGVSGILPIANGGTGSSTQNFVDLTTAQTVAGAKTFSSDMTVNSLKLGLGTGSKAENTVVGYGSLDNNTSGT